MGETTQSLAVLGDRLGASLQFAWVAAVDPPDGGELVADRAQFLGNRIADASVHLGDRLGGCGGRGLLSHQIARSLARPLGTR